MTAAANERTPSESLAFGGALLAAMWLVARPLAGQFNPYSPENGFANAIAMLVALCAAFGAFLHKPRVIAPDYVTLALVLYFGVFTYGLLRSPNLGIGIATYGDALSYAALLAGGYVIARIQPGYTQLLVRVAIAAVAAQALAGVWQHFFDLPRLQELVRQGGAVLPQELESRAGQARLFGSDIFGSFGNPNSFAAYLLVGLGLLAGLAPALWNSKLARRVGMLALILFFLAALLWTNSKGAWVACVALMWFGVFLALVHERPALKPKLVMVSVLGLMLLSLVLLFGMFGWISMPDSLAVRFEYWRAGGSMIVTHPLEGLGLGGFSEHYSFYKTPLGTETRDPHNDYMWFWTDLGLLGPLMFLAVWSVLLNGNMPDAGRRVLEVRTRTRLVCGAGILAFVMMFIGFQPLNAADIPALLAGDVSAQTLQSLASVLLQPVLFAVVFFLTKELPLSRAWYGFVCAASAIQIHQIVDFDFSAPAVMGTLFLLGGLFLGERHVVPDADAPPRRLRIAALAKPFVFVVILLPVGVWFPFTSGLARKNAAVQEDEVRQPRTDSSPQAREDYARLVTDFVTARERAANAAPFDAQAWVDYAEAVRYSARVNRDPVVRQKISVALLRSLELRPFAAAPKAQYANFLLETTDISDASSVSLSRIDLAARMYGAAAERYPLHPGLRLWEGDARLLQLDYEGAARSWEKAFATDVRVADANVALYACFSDPLAGAFPRHGLDAHLLAVIAGMSQAHRIPEKLQAAFELRRVLAMAATLRMMLRSPGHDPIAADRLKVELRIRMRLLPGLFTVQAERAHAAFLHAMSFELTGRETDMKQYLDGWQRAKELQEKAVKAGSPGTPPKRFIILADYYGPKS